LESATGAYGSVVRAAHFSSQHQASMDRRGSAQVDHVDSAGNAGYILSTPSTHLARTSSRAAGSEPNRVFLSGKPATRIGSCGMTQIWRLWRSSRLPSTKYASSCALKGVARRLLMGFRSTGVSRRKRSSRSTRGCISSRRRSLAPTGTSLSTRRHTTSTPPSVPRPCRRLRTETPLIAVAHGSQWPRPCRHICQHICTSLSERSSLGLPPTPRPNSSFSCHIGRFPGILIGIGLGQTFWHWPLARARKAWGQSRCGVPVTLCGVLCRTHRCASLNAPSQNVDVSLCMPQAPFRIAYCSALPWERSLQTSAGYITFPLLLCGCFRSRTNGRRTAWSLRRRRWFPWCPHCYRARTAAALTLMHG
jgi:hypothetical protein